MLRYLFMWLIAVAIPMQGVAGIVAAACMPAHAAGVVLAAPVQVEPAAQPQQQLAQIDTAMAHAQLSLQDSDAASDSTAAAAEYGLAAHDHQGHAGHSTIKCCGVVCSMAAPVMTSLMSRASEPSPALLLAPVAIYQDVVLDGLDRPPRIRPA